MVSDVIYCDLTSYKESVNDFKNSGNKVKKGEFLQGRWFENDQVGGWHPPKNILGEFIICICIIDY